MVGFEAQLKAVFVYPVPWYIPPFTPHIKLKLDLLPIRILELQPNPSHPLEIGLEGALAVAEARACTGSFLEQKV